MDVNWIWSYESSFLNSPFFMSALGPPMTNHMFTPLSKRCAWQAFTSAAKHRSVACTPDVKRPEILGDVFFHIPKTKNTTGEQLNID